VQYTEKHPKIRFFFHFPKSIKKTLMLSGSIAFSKGKIGTLFRKMYPSAFENDPTFVSNQKHKP